MVRLSRLRGARCLLTLFLVGIFFRRTDWFPLLFLFLRFSLFFGSSLHICDLWLLILVKNWFLLLLNVIMIRCVIGAWVNRRAVRIIKTVVLLFRRIFVQFMLIGLCCSVDLVVAYYRLLVWSQSLSRLALHFKALSARSWLVILIWLLCKNILKVLKLVSQ